MDVETAGNLDVNFKAKIKHVIARLVEQRHRGGGPTIAVLDYFWLEHAYYRNRYGLNWAEKARQLFAAFCSLRHIILPCDRLSGEIAPRLCRDFAETVTCQFVACNL